MLPKLTKHNDYSTHSRCCWDPLYGARFCRLSGAADAGLHILRHWYYCLASASPFLARQLAKQPRLGRFLERIELSRGMALTDRAKFILWASAEIFVDKKRS